LDTTLVDSARQIINIIVPTKSNFEIYAPYVAVFVSLLTVVVNIWLNNRQIKNSHNLLEKNNEASWKNTVRNNKLLTQIKTLEEYRNIRLKMVDKMHEVYSLSNFRERQNRLKELLELYKEASEILDKLKVDRIVWTDISNTVSDFMDSFVELEDKDDMMKSIEIGVRFESITYQFIESESRKLFEET